MKMEFESHHAGSTQYFQPSARYQKIWMKSDLKKSMIQHYLLSVSSILSAYPISLTSFPISFHFVNNKSCCFSLKKDFEENLERLLGYPSLNLVDNYPGTQLLPVTQIIIIM